MRTTLLTALLLAGTSVLHAADLAKGRGAEDLFTGKVRPILASRCFTCHGPDEKARKAGLRLDIRDEAIRPLESGASAIVPGDVDESELVNRIFAEDEGELMPPPHAKKPLTEGEKDTLKRWVAEGAEYKSHWSFARPRRASLPEVRRTDWPRNAIDTFVLARLESEGLQPSPGADRTTLARRLSLDLIGLPPTPEEVDAFVNDRADDAYERLVDRLLASPHYGERWARRWLDLARYADTNGYEKDRGRSIWPYRDWVIRALNSDMPFDRFTVEQIAGDMLPGASPDQRIATGFHRNTMLNEEGGIDPREYRFLAMTDRVATTGTVWLGLTIGCAQCHTHKYDPIPHTEYYQFMAFLNNADEPELQVENPEIARQRREAEEKITATVADLPDRFPLADGPEDDDGRPAEVRRREGLERRFHEWLATESARTARWSVLEPVEAKSNLALLTVLGDGALFASGDKTKSDTYSFQFRGAPRGIKAIRIEAFPDDRLPSRGPGRTDYEGPFGDFFLSELTVTVGDKSVPWKGATHSYAKGASGATKAIDGDPQSGWSVDGGQGMAHSAVFTLAAPLGTEDFDLRMLFERYYAAGLGRFRISATTDSTSAPARDMPADVESQLLIPTAERTPEQMERLRQHFLASVPELAKEREVIAKLRKAIPAFPTTLVMLERPPENPRPTSLHRRGEYLQAAEKVEPGVPSILHPLSKEAPRDRLGFARWLTMPENPLVGRVTVNRHWAAIFGQGLVRSAQDFGFQGETPSHPELLDWLAVEFVERGWSVKSLHKLMVMSATYRQDSRVTPGLLAKDAENVLLSRGPRVRLEAEAIRDVALRASGLLSGKVGGPSVFPPQPPGVTTEGTYGSLAWKDSQGEDRYRRGLYTYSKRTSPYAMFATFDGPSGEVCIPRREVSNTPLQALTMLNDPVMIEAAQALGRLTTALAGSVEEKAGSLFRRLLARRPAGDELSMLVQFYESQRGRLERKELDASVIAGPGGPDAVERAAWTVLARSLFNLDEAVTKR